MNVGFDHDILSSFYLWCDDRLGYFAEAYQDSISHTFQYVDTIRCALKLSWILQSL